MTVNYRERLKIAQSKCEAKGVEVTRAEWLMLDLFQWQKTDYLLHADEIMTEAHNVLFDNAEARMLQGEPIQYIVGTQSFYGEIFKVNEHCLIPRPETEEVVLHFYNLVKSGDKVVDIGTGSGNIPILLKKMNQYLDVLATDLYDAALSVAKDNAQYHDVDITFLQGDALNPLIEKNIKVNGLISNPPYIADSEKTLMEDTVLRYEPTSALFAENNGFQVYDKILEQLPDVLLPNAIVVFEIGYKQGLTLKKKIEEKYPAVCVQIIKDINNNDRIISFEW